ncbi:MAG: pentapeptide repeat-containing protein [bacterium]|nr:pentapeptide repeat-containing protein [bacterium]
MLKRFTSRLQTVRKNTLTQTQLFDQLKTAPNDAALILLEEAQERLYFQDGSLRGADFSGAQWQKGRMAKGDYERIILANADLRGIYLGGANLIRANLQNANLADANLRDANFTGANLSGAILTGAHMAGVNLCGANLTGANLDNANLWGVQFDEATIMTDGTLWRPAKN